MPIKVDNVRGEGWLDAKYLKNTTDQFDGDLTIDNTSTEALLVRKDADGGDVFVVDTTNGTVSLGGVTPVTGTRLLLPQENDATTPTLAFGDGDTGIYEISPNKLGFVSYGSLRFSLSTSYFAGSNPNGPGMINQTTRGGGGTLVTLLPNLSGDFNTGIGNPGDDYITLVVGGKVGMGVRNIAGAITVDMFGIVSLNDNNITNVGDIEVDSISPDATDINIMKDAEGDVILFGITDVADTADGKSLFIKRQAAEGDNYLKIQILADQAVLIDANTGILLQSNTNIRTVGSNLAFGEDWGTNTRTVQQLGYITGAAAQKYIEWDVEDSDDWFNLRRQDNNILGFKVNMPLDLVGNGITNAGDIDLGDAGGFSGMKFDPTSTELRFFIDGTQVGHIGTNGAYVDDIP